MILKKTTSIILFAIFTGVVSVAFSTDTCDQELDGINQQAAFYPIEAPGGCFPGPTGYCTCSGYPPSSNSGATLSGTTCTSNGVFTPSGKQGTWENGNWGNTLTCM